MKRLLTMTALATVLAGPAIMSHAVAGPSGGATYTTDFPLTENPISEGGNWVEGGKATGVDWNDVRTEGGLAYGTQSGSGGYDDSIAYLGGFGHDYRLDATIHLAAGAQARATKTHEVELILRGTMSAHDQQHYECNVGYAGGGFYSQIIKLSTIDGLGNIQIDNLDGGNATPTIHDGDIFTAQIVGNRLSTYVTHGGVQTPLQEATDSSYASGYPGIGFFWRGTEQITDFAFSDLTVTDLSAVRPSPPTNVTVR